MFRVAMDQFYRGIARRAWERADLVSLCCQTPFSLILNWIYLHDHASISII
jgi:hypothetical protein